MAPIKSLLFDSKNLETWTLKMVISTRLSNIIQKLLVPDLLFAEGERDNVDGRFCGDR